LRLLLKDVGLAVGLGCEVGVPMRLANVAYEELTAAMNRGWVRATALSAKMIAQSRVTVVCAQSL
jgi:hypothetical protein